MSEQKMFSFACEQETVKVGKTVFGGQPGENPTVCFGTLFWGKKWGVLDDKKLAEAKKLVQTQEKLSEKYCVPALADVYVKEEDAEEKVRFISKATKKPFAIDASSPKARIMGLEAAAKLKVLDRLIYNSINIGITAEELAALEENTPAAAILLAYNPKDLSVDGRLKILE
ncbi:MAG TPA: hypothetical protein ENN13_03625, partial [Candidatus Altiarchaeales archaeon]|nr:hypothetical protein [Candidatus Altiarchaeales archaeon]